MKLEIDDNLFYALKDSLMVEFLKDDLKTVKICLKNSVHEDDEQEDKKLIKAYKLILKYYGVKDD